MEVSKQVSKWSLDIGGQSCFIGRVLMYSVALNLSFCTAKLVKIAC